MSVSTLIAAQAFTGNDLERVERLFLKATGLLIPLIARRLSRRRFSLGTASV